MSDAIAWRDQALIDSGKAATHALVIGVGDYPHLNGGSGRLTTKHDGLGQLSSPPVSAFHFAAWLLDEFNNPDKPLASLSLLLAADDDPAFEHPQLDHPFDPPRADVKTVPGAVRAWKALGDASEENLVLFFFCGHGVARGLDGLSLLLSDYGEIDDMPMAGAVDFAAFQRGMAQCAASQQCFFVDACRQVTDLARRTSETGNSIIQDDINRPFASPWNYAVLYSTIEGEAAYGRRDKPSFYTEELIKGLNGKAANNRKADGKWRVGTLDLMGAFHHGLSLHGDVVGNPGGRVVQFDFHRPRKDPVVPVTVFCDPESQNANATLSCEQDGAVIHERQPAAENWVTELACAQYDFVARIGAQTKRRDKEYVMPPYRDIAIEVAS